MNSPLEVAVAVIQLFVCVLSYRSTREQVVAFATRTPVKAYRVKAGLIGTTLILFGTLPAWPRETPLLPGPNTTAWEPLFTLLNFTVAAFVVIAGIALLGHWQNHRKIILEHGMLTPRTVGRVPWLAIVAGISYPTILVLTLAMKRVWALNRDPLVIWLLALICATLLFAEKTGRIAKLTYGVSALAILGILAYNLWGLCCTDAGTLTWALLSGVFPGMYLGLAGSVAILSGLRGGSSQG